jgi:phenylalanyl-tRNA synthetase beta chain
VKIAALLKYPAVERDFSFVFADNIDFGRIERAVVNLNLREVRAFTPVEIFRGESIGAGKYSILLRVKLQSEEGTLRDDHIASASDQIIKALQELGGVQRA